jgi:hypothetical protein
LISHNQQPAYSHQLKKGIDMNFKSISMVLTASSFFGITPVWSQDLVVYPAKGQSNDQMEKDKFECYSWAKEQTGFDPMAMPQATAPPPKQEAQKGGVGRGALRGGAVGLAVGAIGGDAKRGAAIGAVCALCGSRAGGAFLDLRNLAF